MKDQLIELMKILKDKNISTFSISYNETARNIVEEIAKNSKFNTNDDILEILFEEFSNNGFNVLKTVGREEPYEHHGEFMQCPWKDSSGKSNKYTDKDLGEFYELAFDESVGADVLRPKKDSGIKEVDGVYVDKEGDPILYHPNPEDYDVVLINYMRT